MKQLIYAGRVLNISVKTHGYDGYRLQEGTAHVSRNDLKIHPSLFSKWLAVAREGI